MIAQKSVLFFVISLISMSAAYAAGMEVGLNYMEYKLATGDTLTLVAMVRAESALNLSGKWLSNNEVVATVDRNGCVKAITEGVAIITFTADNGSQTVQCSVTVNKKEVTGKECIAENQVYITENLLYIKTPSTNDLIFVYTTSGLCIDKFIKDTDLIVKETSAYPKGMLIITNGKDWTAKVTK